MLRGKPVLIIINSFDKKLRLMNKVLVQKVQFCALGCNLAIRASDSYGYFKNSIMLDIEGFRNLP